MIRVDGSARGFRQIGLRVKMVPFIKALRIGTEPDPALEAP
jgi:hypothetical protein